MLLILLLKLPQVMPEQQLVMVELDLIELELVKQQLLVK